MEFVFLSNQPAEVVALPDSLHLPTQWATATRSAQPRNAEGLVPKISPIEQEETNHPNPFSTAFENATHKRENITVFCAIDCVIWIPESTQTRLFHYMP
ncbi:hypothetical protein [Chitinophaga jiangningensis]|uniref:hypothetical protein n=1 Tax=Chitinophaga jiangningensis TaxID=1419482 RepID=UPI000934C5BF|nr:hypothetical protein [Chitinophaga jiangningensis]